MGGFCLTSVMLACDAISASHVALRVVPGLDKGLVRVSDQCPTALQTGALHVLLPHDGSILLQPGTGT